MIRVRNIWKIYGSTPEAALARARRDEAAPGHVVAVRDVSIEVGRGETFVVMGLSGSGKSTLLRCVARLIEATAGEVVIDGADILKYDAATMRELRRRKISMVFQNFGLLPHRRVIDNVAYGLEIRGEKRPERERDAREMIDLVGLNGWEQRYPRELSGGMQQRVGLARALANNPEIMLFDEPFSALDPLIRREMQDELIRLQSHLHKTSIFVTHDFAEAMRLGDRIAIMRNGRVAQIGTPQELVLNPADDYVAAFVKDAPRERVITCASVMHAAPAGYSRNDAATVFADTPLSSVLIGLARSDAPVAVLNAADEVVGLISREDVIRVMAGV
jgi:glycine betaine/proline transport system ATP-binding protein